MCQNIKKGKSYASYGPRGVQYGHKRREHDCIMRNDPIEISHKEKDFGVLITDKLEVTEQCAEPKLSHPRLQGKLYARCIYIVNTEP